MAGGFPCKFVTKGEEAQLGFFYQNNAANSAEIPHCSLLLERAHFPKKMAVHSDIVVFIRKEGAVCDIWDLHNKHYLILYLFFVYL